MSGEGYRPPWLDDEYRPSWLDEPIQLCGRLLWQTPAETFETAERLSTAAPADVIPLRPSTEPVAQSKPSIGYPEDPAALLRSTDPKRVFQALREMLGGD